jgi:hypothetical protein
MFTEVNRQKFTVKTINKIYLQRSTGGEKTCAKHLKFQTPLAQVFWQPVPNLCQVLGIGFNRLKQQTCAKTCAIKTSKKQQTCAMCQHYIEYSVGMAQVFDCV